MQGVLSGFFIIAAIVAAGIALGYSGVLGNDGRIVLNRLTYFLAGPALVFVALLNSDPSIVFSHLFTVAALASLLALAVGYLAIRLVCRRRGSVAIIGSVSASMVNSANIGFPIAIYVLGDLSYALPVALWQMAVYTPLFQFALHTSVAHARPSLRSVAAAILANPMILAVIAAIGMLALNYRPPAFMLEPVTIIAGISIPAMLLAFGMSLTMSRPFSKADGVRGDIIIVTLVKLVVMPAGALVIAAMGFGLRGSELYAIVVMAALPTAQNVYVAASRYETGEELARDAALFTSIGSLGTLLLASALLSPTL